MTPGTEVIGPLLVIGVLIAAFALTTRGLRPFGRRANYHVRTRGDNLGFAVAGLSVAKLLWDLGAVPPDLRTFAVAFGVIVMVALIVAPKLTRAAVGVLGFFAVLLSIAASAGMARSMWFLALGVALIILGAIARAVRPH